MSLSISLIFDKASDAVHFRKPDVEEDDVRHSLFQQREASSAVGDESTSYPSSSNIPVRLSLIPSSSSTSKTVFF